MKRLTVPGRSPGNKLAAHEALCPEPGTSLFVLAGSVSLEQAGMWMATRGSMRVEATRPVRVVARESTQLLLLPRAP